MTEISRRVVGSRPKKKKEKSLFVKVFLDENLIFYHSFLPLKLKPTMSIDYGSLMIDQVRLPDKTD